MGRKILIGAAAVITAAFALLIWRLDIPNWKKLDLNALYAQPRSTTVYDADGETIGVFSSSAMRLWLPISDIPPHVQNAFIAAEDQRFFEHNGVSFRRIVGALLNNIRTRSYSQGASTITQQLIKLTHLSQSKTISRKAQEAVLALQLEKKLTKEEILECYLNTIYFGNGAYGVGAAAEKYFSKNVSELTVAESALLAGVIKAPSVYAPHINPEKAMTRRDIILNEMKECSYITEAQLLSAKQEKLRLAMRDSGKDGSGWFMDAALEEASELLGLGIDEVLSSGFCIYTAYDPEIQFAAEGLFEDGSNFPPDAADGTPVQAALIAMNPETGEIRAMIGGRKYEVQRGFNRATQMRRSPGSAIKPVSTYAAAVDAYGLTPSSMIEDTPREFEGGYSPGNAGGNYYGTVTLREALSRSLNIATVDLADLIGMNTVRNYAVRFGIDPSPEDNNLALALGSMTYGVTPEDLCAAYSTLANGGMRVEPHLISSISDRDGNILYKFETSPYRAVKDSTAFMVTDMLTTAAAEGSAKKLSQAGIPIAGKTGTVADTDGSTRDIWTAAYTPDLAAAVWMGFDAPDAQHQLASSEGGSGYPALLCAGLFRNCSELLCGEKFVKPESVKNVLVDRIALQSDQVLLATEQTPSEYVVTELFLSDSIPQSVSSNWVEPKQITDLKMLSGPGETPVVQFTVQDNRSEYLLLRTTGAITEIAATLSGDEGTMLRFADTEADLSRTITYSILPRHRMLYEKGTLLTGKESAAVTYSPGGIMDFLFGSGDGKSTPEPADIELFEDQSLFS